MKCLTSLFSLQLGVLLVFLDGASVLDVLALFDSARKYKLGNVRNHGH